MPSKFRRRPTAAAPFFWSQSAAEERTQAEGLVCGGFVVARFCFAFSLRGSSLARMGRRTGRFGGEGERRKPTAEPTGGWFPPPGSGWLPLPPFISRTARDFLSNTPDLIKPAARARQG